MGYCLQITCILIQVTTAEANLNARIYFDFNKIILCLLTQTPDRSHSKRLPYADKNIYKIDSRDSARKFPWALHVLNLDPLNPALLGKVNESSPLIFIMFIKKPIIPNSTPIFSVPVIIHSNTTSKCSLASPQMAKFYDSSTSPSLCSLNCTSYTSKAWQVLFQEKIVVHLENLNEY